VRRLVLAASICLFFVPACSSSPSGPTGWPFTRRPVDEAARTAAMTAIGARVDELAANGQSQVSQNKAIAEYLRTAPEVAIAAESADGAVGYFYDGQAFIILNNTFPDGSTGSSSSPLLQPGGDVSQKPSGLRFPMASGGTDLPWGRVAYLANGFPQNADSMKFPPDPTSDLARALGDRKYSTTTFDATVSNLAAVSGDGVVHIRTHGGGGCFDNRGGPCEPTWDPNKEIDETDPNFWPQVLYGLWSKDVDNEQNRAAHVDELKDGQLVHMWESTGVWSHEWHLGITGRFVTKKWGSLSQNPYVHISACSGSSKEALATLVKAIKGKSSGILYVGWSAPTIISDLDKVAKLMFDRLLGANLLDPKEDPPQRAFEVDPVVDDVWNRGWGVSAGSQLAPQRLGAGGLAILAPSIMRLEALDSDDSLVLYGRFGDNKANGKVTVGGADCSVIDWSSSIIRCKLDKTAKGEVVVTVNDHESNKVKLTSWRGKFTYAIESTTPGLSQVWTIELHLRGDVGDYRDKPGEQPKAQAKWISAAKDTKVSVAAGGAAMGSCNATWTQAASISVQLWGTPVLMGPGTFLHFAGAVDDGDPNHLWFELAGYAAPCYTLGESGDTDCKPLATDIACSLPNGGMSSGLGSHHFTDFISARLKDPASIDQNGTIQAYKIGPIEHPTCCGGEWAIPWDYTQRANWDAMSPEGGSGPSRSSDVR
jgi:hypothetical protein